jgi:hypothetical protein
MNYFEKLDRIAEEEGYQIDSMYNVKHKNVKYCARLMLIGTSEEAEKRVEELCNYGVDTNLKKKIEKQPTKSVAKANEMATAENNQVEVWQVEVNACKRKLSECENKLAESEAKRRELQNELKNKTSNRSSMHL